MTYEISGYTGIDWRLETVPSVLFSCRPLSVSLSSCFDGFPGYTLSAGEKVVKCKMYEKITLGDPGMDFHYISDGVSLSSCFQ